jgi:hypothetical protein
MSERNARLLKITVEHPDFGLYEGDIDVDLKVDKSNLSDEMEEQPSKYAWWASLTELVRLQFNKRKLGLSIYEAELDKKFREEMGGKVTEAQMKGLTARDEKWQSLNLEVIELKYKLGVLEAATWAFSQRADMIKALAPSLAYEGRSVMVKGVTPVRHPVEQ